MPEAAEVKMRYDMLVIPIGPAPMTPKRAGSSVKLKMVALVKQGTTLSPGMTGILAVPPEAITAVAKLRVCSATWMLCLLVKVAWP